MWKITKFILFKYSIKIKIIYEKRYFQYYGDFNLLFRTVSLQDGCFA